MKRRKLTATQEKKAYDACTERDLGQCQRCGSRGPTDRDHRQNRDRYNTTPANLQLLGGAFGCGCHQWKTENPHEAMREGFSVPRWGDPLEWPAYRVWDGWVRYFDVPDRFGRWWEPVTESAAVAYIKEKLDGS